MRKSLNANPLSAQDRTERLRLAAIDGEKARAEYDGSAASVEERTVRLRALRLERDRAAAEEAEAAPAKKKAAAKPAAKVNRRNIPVG